MAKTSMKTLPLHRIEKALLEYSDRVIFSEVGALLERHGKHYRYPSNAQLSGLFQMARGVRSPEGLFAKDPHDTSFQNFINHRIELALRRRSSHEEHFFHMISNTLFGITEHALRRASSAILGDFYAEKKDIPPQYRGYSQVFLFQEWMKHFYLKAKFLGRL